MFQTRAACQKVIGDVEDVVCFSVGHVQLQDVQPAIDLAVQFQLLHHLVNKPNTPCGNCFYSIGDFILNVRCAQSRSRTKMLLVDSFRDSSLAIRQLLSYLGVHSKILRARVPSGFGHSMKPRKTPKVFEFFHATTHMHCEAFAWLRTRFLPDAIKWQRVIERTADCLLF